MLANKECVRINSLTWTYEPCVSTAFEFIRCEFGKAECEHWRYTYIYEIDENFARLQVACAVPVLL